MPEEINVYCDESCHLQNDHAQVMVLGAVLCPADNARGVADAIRQLKRRSGLSDKFEVKWTKVSPGLSSLYLALIDYFFDEPALRFRALVVPNKDDLNHEAFGHDHDTFYYKMYYDMLKPILPSGSAYRIYIDMKDTRSAAKERKLHDVLCNSFHDFDRQRVQRLQAVRSHDVEQIQLADLLIGAVGYANRGLTTSAAKLAVVEHIRNRSGYSLTSNTPLSSRKVNLLKWRATQIAG